MRYCLLLLACLMIASCSAGSDTTPNGPLNKLFWPPHIGTMFTLSEWDVDSTMKKGQERGARTYTVDSSGFSHAGKATVMSLAYDARNQFMYISYEANGNISVLDRLTQQWQELPVATQDTRVWTGADTNKNGYVFTEERTTSYAGSEVLTFAGRSFNTVKIREMVRDWHNGVLDSSEQIPQTFWYSPEFGWYIKYLGPSQDGSYGFLSEMESFTLK